MFTFTTITPHRLRELFRRARLLLHEEGFLSLFPQLLMCKNYYNIYENNLDGPRFPCKVDNLTLRIITCPEEFDQLSAEGFNFSEHAKTITSGEMLFFTFIGKEIVHVNRAFMRRRGVYTHFCPSSMDDGHTVYMGGFWTAPKYRRKGINTFIFSKVLHYLRDRGVSRVVIIVHPDNIAIVNSLAKVDCYLWGEGYHLKLLFLFNFWRVKSKSGATFE